MTDGEGPGERNDDPDGPPGPGSEEPEGAPVGAPPAAGRRFRRSIVTGIVLVLAAGGGGVALVVRGGGCPPAGAVVEVGDVAISRAEYDRRLELLATLYGLKAPDAAGSEQARAFPGEVAKSLAVGLMIESQVGRKEIRAADRDVRDAFDRFIADRFPEGGRAAFITALEAEGVSEADVLAEFRRLLQTRRLFESVTADVTVTDEEVAEAFEARQDQLAVPERRKVRHLVVAGEAEARAASDRIRAGEGFAAVAKAVSLDASTREGGGDLGLLAPGQLAEAFSAAAFSATPGLPFGPVQTDLGWHVGLVEEVVPGHPVTLDDVRGPLSEQLVGEAKLAEWRAYLTREIEAADACYAEGFEPADPAAPPADISPGVGPDG